MIKYIFNYNNYKNQKKSINLKKSKCNNDIEKVNENDNSNDNEMVNKNIMINLKTVNYSRSFRDFA